MSVEKPQPDKFKEIARELEAGEDETRWEGQSHKVALRKPAPGTRA